jgi:hypothetical protein
LIVVLCRRIDLFSDASVAIDGSKFKAVNTRDRNFTQVKMSGAWSRSTKASTFRKARRSRPSVLFMSASSDMIFRASYE